eukprot:TRINITY_DN5842_c0_g1_i1.p1 TRINITY_DN5842_c0_g1~~TRINITY_DN5842_c0_g1_i1.p1  ORF type:complete len:681 (-),score=99.65 TRINITY_DN5842_c0_g1_i1:246-2288(-)
MVVLGTSPVTKNGRLSISSSVSPDRKEARSQHTPDVTPQANPNASAEKHCEDAKSRVRDDVNPEIQDVLRTKKSNLVYSDFDIKAKQCLHAIHGKGGRESVREALQLVAEWSSKKAGRQSVQNWPAYIGAILWRYLDKFEADIRSADATRDRNDQTARAYTVQWKKPPAAERSGAIASSNTDDCSGDITSKKWFHKLFAQQSGSEPYVKPKEQQWWKNMGGMTVHEKPHAPYGSWNNLEANDSDWWTGYCSPTRNWDIREVKQTQKTWMNAWSEMDSVPSSKPSYKAKDGSRRSVAGQGTGRQDNGHSEVSKAAHHDSKKKPRQSYGGIDTDSSTSRRKARASWAPGAEWQTASPERTRNPRKSWSSGAKEQAAETSEGHGANKGVSDEHPWTSSGTQGTRSPQREQKWQAKSTSALPCTADISMQTLKETVNAWAQSRRILADDVRIISLSAGTDGKNHAVSLLLRAVEIIVDLDAANSAECVAVGAHTRMPWPALKRCIRTALETTQGLSFTEFLDAVWLSWPASEEDEASLLDRESWVPAPTSPPRPSQTFNSENRLGDVSVAIDEDFFEGDDEFDLPLTPVGLNKVQDMPVDSTARSFCSWLNRRRPLWRFDGDGNGIAWDFPQSKTEKRELLLLNVLAEGEELKCENADRKAEQEALLNEVEVCNMELDKYRYQN